MGGHDTERINKGYEHQESINAKRVILVDSVLTPNYDLLTVTYPSSTVEVYTFELSSTIVQIVTVTYIDFTKELIDTVVKS